MSRTIRFVVAAVLAAGLSLAVAAQANASFAVDRFHTLGDARAGWIATSPPAGATDADSMELFVNASSSQDFGDAAWVVFKGFPSAPPAQPPSFDLLVSRVGPSGGSVRLLMTFSDGGRGELRPLTLVSGQWTHQSGGASDWDSVGGSCGFSFQQSYSAMLACHRGASVTGVEILNDSGWLYPGGFQALVDNVSYGGETISFPPPVLGQEVNLAPVSGQVTVRLPRQRGKALKLGLARQVPVGTVVDVTGGKVKLISARDRRGHTQVGEFFEGKFQVRQSRKRHGLTELRLRGPVFEGCGATAGKATAARRRRHRRLWGRGRGRYRTRGRGSSASVRGTVWLVEDLCDGTLTRVLRGKVLVNDFALHRKILLRAHHSYLARYRRR